MAIELAGKGLYTASPNPRVGCVLVNDGVVIGQGFHLKSGEGHAEVNAIADARASGHGDAVAGSTAYVTLEPCSHTGKTPPCTEALINANVASVVVAMVDPNPLVSGSGVSKLRSAGIAVSTGLLESEARQLNRGFIKRMEQDVPWVRVKTAMSLDGRTAMASGESQWITGSQARSDVQRMRASSCAIVTGVDTVISDNASLTVREQELGLAEKLAAQAVVNQPLRVVMDSRLRLPATAKILAQPGRTIVMTAAENNPAQTALQDAGAEVVVCGKDGKIDLLKALRWLAKAQCNEVMIEAGATLAGAFTRANLVDHYTIYIAPTLMGSLARPMLELPLDTMAQQKRLNIESITPIGNDWRIEANTGA